MCLSERTIEKGFPASWGASLPGGTEDKSVFLLMKQAYLMKTFTQNGQARGERKTRLLIKPHRHHFLGDVKNDQ